MAMVATSIPTIGFTEYVLPITTGLYYFATPENNWASLIHPHVPEWMVPQNPDAIRYFYEGLPEGRPLPWGAWLEPLAYWCLFILAFYWVSICAMVIVAPPVAGKRKTALSLGPSSPRDDSKRWETNAAGPFFL